MLRFKVQYSIAPVVEADISTIVFMAVSVPKEPTFVLWMILAVLVKQDAFLARLLHF